MAIAQGGGIENSGMDESLLKYKDKDNIKDKLKELQDEISKINKNKTNNKLDENKTKSAFENLDSFAELKFDSYIQDNWSHVKDLLTNKKNAELANEFNDKILKGSDFQTYFNQLKDFEISANTQNFKFEINDLRDEVQKEINKKDNNDKEIDKFDNNNTYGYKEDKFNLNEKGQKGYIKFNSPDMSFNNDDLIDIFDKSGLKKEIETVIGEDLGGLNKRNFKINLSTQNGLAGLISYIDSNNPKLRDQIESSKDIKKLKNGGIYKDKNGSGNDIDRGNGFEYDREGGRDTEKNKIAKIIKNGNDNQDFQKALIKFADRTKGFGTEYQKRFKQGANFQTNIEQLDITENNILESLCDFNGDGKLAVNYHEYQARSQFRNTRKQNHKPLPNDRREQRKKDREQHKQEGKNNKKERKGIENQGDVGTIFGPQLYDAVDTAIQIGETKIQNRDKTIIKKYPNATSGENIVIYNIIQNIRIFNENPELEEKLKNFDITQCNKLNLFHLIKTDDNALDFQPLFAKAIETINGSSSTLAPNLVDKLLGIDRLIEDNIPTASFQHNLDAYCEERWKNTEQGKNFLSKYGEDGLLTMKEGLIDLFSFVDVDAMLNDEGKLLGLGISKSRDLNRRKHELENSFFKTFLGPSVSIGIDPTTGKIGFDLSMNYGQTGTSENLKSKRSRNTSAGAFGISLEESKVSIMPHISIGGEKDRQINYKNVVTSPLDVNISSKYIGIEGGVSGGLIGPVPVGTIEGGLVYKNDPKSAIEQMYKQYNDITSLIFNLNGATKNNIKDGVNLENFLTNKYTEIYNKYNTQNNKGSKLISEFMKNNENFLKTNIKEIVKYMEFSGILATLNSSDIGNTDPIKSANSFINIMQKGITNSRRENKYEQLSGSYNISKIGVGAGAIVMPGMKPMPYPKFSLQVSRRANNYLPDKAQKNIDAFLINQGTIDEQTDMFEPNPPTITAYGKYLEAIFNIKEFDKTNNTSKSLLETGEIDGKLYIKYLGTDGHIFEKIDIRAKGNQDVLDNIKFTTDPADGKSMIIIGNVGKISAFTQSDGGGKRCFLVLGGYGTNATCILPKNHNENKLTNQIQNFDLGFQKTGEYEERNKTKIQSEIIDKITNSNVNDMQKTETAKTTIGSFFDNDGKIKNPDQTNIKVNDPNSLIGTKLKVGTFTIEKTKGKVNGKDEFTISLDETDPTDKLKINYIDKADDPNIDDLKNNDNNYKKNDEIIFNSSTDFFSIDKHTELKEAQTIIDGLKSKLRDLEKLSTGSGSKDAYLKFMYYISNIDTTDTNGPQIDDKEINNSINELSDPKMLGGTDFTNLLNILKNGDYMTKSRILDQLKSIFAKQESYYGKTINKIVGGRGNIFATTLYGPSGETFNKNLQRELIEKKGTILKNYGNNTFNENPGPEKNLIGYTAFYREGKEVKNKNKRYSMTCIGQTTIQGEEIKINNQIEAIDRFTKNLKANKYEMELFINIIKDHTNFTLTDDEIINLLKNPNKEVSIDNGKKKITLKSECIFYLAGECCNESVGIRINSIQTQEIKPELLNQGFTAEGDSQEISTGPGVGGVNTSNRMKVGSYDKTYGASISMIKTKAPRLEPQDKDYDGGGAEGGNSDNSGGGAE